MNNDIVNLFNNIASEQTKQELYNLYADCFYENNNNDELFTDSESSEEYESEIDTEIDDTELQDITQEMNHIYQQ